MNCCDKDEKMEEKENTTKVKGGKTIKMDRRIVMWIVIGVLFIAVLFLIFKAGGGGATGNAIQTAGNAVKSAAPSSSGMVGGC